MKHLNEYANDFLINDNPFAFESYYDSVFKKVDIYNKNTRLINEGKYNSLPTHITYSSYEQAAISEMLFGLQFKYLYNALDESIKLDINEGFGDVVDKMKEALSKGKETFTNYIKELLDKIPSNIKEAYDKLGEIAEKGISNVKEFLNKILKVFKLIGDNLNEVLDKLWLFKDAVVSEIPDVDVSNDVLSEIFKETGNKEKVVKFLIAEVQKGVNNKSVVKDFSLNGNDEVNEGIGKKIIGTTVAAGGLLVAPGPTLLVLGTIVGSILLYKGTKGLGKFLSKKLEPYLLSDKVKVSIEKMYNNKIIRYGLGLKVSDKSNEELSGFKKILKMIHSILINIVIASLIIAVLSFVGSVLLEGLIGSVGVTIFVAAIVAGKNIFTTIANRILNFKKVKGDDKNKETYFFDFLTMFSILSSILTFLWQIPTVKEWTKDLWDKVSDLMLNSGGVNAQASTIERQAALGYFDEDGNFQKYKDMEIILANEKYKQIPVLNPKDNNYYILGDDGNLELVPWKKMIRSGLVKNTEVGSFASTKEGLNALKDIEGWSAVHVESISRSTTEEINKTISSEVGEEMTHEFTRNMQHMVKTIQCLTTESGETYVSVVFSKSTDQMCKTCFSDEVTVKSVSGIIRHVFNIDELDGNFAELIGTVKNGPSYSSYDELFKNEEFINKAFIYAVSKGKSEITELIQK